jgi:hypothetical protein
MQKPKIDVGVLCCLPGFPAVPHDLDHHFRYRFLCVGFRNVNNVTTGFDALIVLLIVIPILSVNQVRFELSNYYRKPIQVIFSLEEWCHER